MTPGHGFDRLVAVVIVANTALLMWGVIGHNELADRLETLCLAFFVGEILWRLHQHRWQPVAFLRHKWNAFDTAVILLAFMPSLGVGVTLLRVARLARIVHLGRHVTHLRLFRVLTTQWEKVRM